MKNIFKNLFGNNRSAHALNNTSENGIHSDISEDLFIEKETLEEEPQPLPQKAKSHLARFLERDFYSMGFQDGYIQRSSALRDITIRKIKADFRLCIDRQIQEVNDQVIELEKHLIDINGISSEFTAKIMIFKRKFEQDLERLEKEKQQSAIDEGLVMVAVHQYHEGYHIGLSKYQNEKLLIEGNGLF